MTDIDMMRHSVHSSINCMQFRRCVRKKYVANVNYNNWAFDNTLAVFSATYTYE